MLVPLTWLPKAKQVLVPMCVSVAREDEPTEVLAYEDEVLWGIVGFAGRPERQRRADAVGENEGARLNRVGAEFTRVVDTGPCARNNFPQLEAIITGIVEAFVGVHGGFTVS